MLLCGSSGAILSRWQGWGAAGVDGQEHLGSLRWDEHPSLCGRVVEYAATATPGEQVSNAVMVSVCIHTFPSIYILLISLQDGGSGCCCIPFRSCYWPEMMSVLPRLGAPPLAVSRDAAVSWKCSSHSWGLQCVFAGHAWTQIDGERSGRAR